jgi:hypothetical protein
MFSGKVAKKPDASTPAEIVEELEAKLHSAFD